MEIAIVETRFVVEMKETDSYDRPMLLTFQSDSFDVDKSTMVLFSLQGIEASKIG